MGLLDKFHSFVHSPIHSVLTGGLHQISQGLVDQVDPFEAQYKAGKKARDARRALSAQEQADLQAERDQKTEEELLANNQRVASKRSYVANSLALGGPPIMAGANVLAAGAGGAGPVTSSSPGGYGGGYSPPTVLGQGGALGGNGAMVAGTPFRARRAIVPGVMSRG